MTAHQVVARYTVAEGNEDEVLALLRQLAEASRSEPGNLAFTVYRELDDPQGIVLLERYTSRDAFATHRETAHFKELVLARIVPLLDSRTVEEYEVPE